MGQLDESWCERRAEGCDSFGIALAHHSDFITRVAPVTHQHPVMANLGAWPPIPLDIGDQIDLPTGQQHPASRLQPLDQASVGDIVERAESQEGARKGGSQIVRQRLPILDIEPADKIGREQPIVEVHEVVDAGKAQEMVERCDQPAQRQVELPGRQGRQFLVGIANIGGVARADIGAGRLAPVGAEGHQPAPDLPGAKGCRKIGDVMRRRLLFAGADKGLSQRTIPLPCGVRNQHGSPLRPIRYHAWR
jgi:hypothetical protein